MALRIICDGGCGANTENPEEFGIRGIAIKRQYCPDCLPVIDAYLKARNDLHTEAAKLFTNGMTTMRTAFQEQFPNGKLPDES